jgi:tryptophanyl-tRNA synthetase
VIEINFQKRRVLSAIQPTGYLHLGNLLGAINRWVQMQHQFETFVPVADLHAITVPQNPTQLRTRTRQLAMLLMAAGLDPNKATLFVQSHVPAHTELAWILNCITPTGRLGGRIFDYAFLQAADILIYQAHYIPVGEDLKRNIELTRHIAQRFNSLYGKTFVLPKPLIGKAGARIMGLVNPTTKMSKSENNPDDAIYLLDPPEVIRQKIARATTDSSTEGVRFDPGRPGIHNLAVIYRLCSHETPEAIEARYRDKGYADFKRDLADVVIEGLRPLQSRYADLARDPAEIERLLKQGADRAASVAERTLREVKERVGLG